MQKLTTTLTVFALGIFNMRAIASDPLTTALESTYKKVKRLERSALETPSVAHEKLNNMQMALVDLKLNTAFIGKTLSPEQQKTLNEIQDTIVNVKKVAN